MDGPHSWLHDPLMIVCLSPRASGLWWRYELKSRAYIKMALTPVWSTSQCPPSPSPPGLGIFLPSPTPHGSLPFHASHWSVARQYCKGVPRLSFCPLGGSPVWREMAGRKTQAEQAVPETPCRCQSCSLIPSTPIVILCPLADWQLSRLEKHLGTRLGRSTSNAGL